MLNSTTAARPPPLFSQANTTSDNHSHAYQGSPALENEKRSRAGTPWLATIHSPVRMCQPVSQSASSVLTPSIRPNRNTIGIRNAKSASDGSSLTANWDRCASMANQAIQELAIGCRASIARIWSWNERKSM